MSERMSEWRWNTQLKNYLAEESDRWEANECREVAAELDRARAAEVRLCCAWRESECALNAATRELESLKQSTRDKGKLESRIRAIVREEIRAAIWGPVTIEQLARAAAPEPPPTYGPPPAGFGPRHRVEPLTEGGEPT